MNIKIAGRTALVGLAVFASASVFADAFITNNFESEPLGAVPGGADGRLPGNGLWYNPDNSATYGIVKDGIGLSGSRGIEIGNRGNGFDARRQHLWRRCGRVPSSEWPRRCSRRHLRGWHVLRSGARTVHDWDSCRRRRAFGPSPTQGLNFTRRSKTKKSPAECGGFLFCQAVNAYLKKSIDSSFFLKVCKNRPAR